MGQRRQTGRKSRGIAKYGWLAVLLVIAASIALTVSRQAVPPEVSRGPEVSAAASGAFVARRETRPTLDPARFVGKAAVTHQVARDIPDVLDQLYCYCECDKTVGHKSLLSCYTDGHAAT